MAAGKQGKDLEKMSLFPKYWENPSGSGILKRTLFTTFSLPHEEEVE
jgi:hypothetical protein